MKLLRQIDLAAGAESRYADQLPQLLGALREQARIESITASNAIEGVVVNVGRVPKLVSGGAERFRTRNEAEFAGYTAALNDAYARLAWLPEHRVEPKQDRVRSYVLLHPPETFAIADIRRAVPGVSENTIRLVLVALRDGGRITSGGTGRGASWHRI